MSESITSVKPEDPTPTLTSPREVKGFSPSSTPRPGQGYWAMLSGQFPSTVLYPGMAAFSIGLPIIMYFMFGAFQNYSTEIMGRGNVAAMVMFQLGSWGAFLAAASMGAAVGIERTAGWTRQLSLTPATSLTYFAVKVTLAVCSAALSIVVLLAVGAIFNARAEWWVWIAVPLTTLACCIVPAIMGLAIGYMVRSDAAYGIIGGGSAILGFLSGTFMQVEAMPNLDGIALTEKIHATYPNIRVLVVTTFGRPGYLRRALEAGAAGFIVKDSPAESLVDAIRKVADGRLVIDPELAAESLAAGNDPLTDRERDALREVERGGTAAQIAERLHLSPGTVRNHLSAAIQKTGTGSRVEAARLARNNGWL